MPSTHETRTQPADQAPAASNQVPVTCDNSWDEMCARTQIAAELKLDPVQYLHGIVVSADEKAR